MLCLLIVLWIIFNGRLSLEIFLFGLLFVAAVFLFMCKFMGYSFKKEVLLYRLVPNVAAYAVLLVWEIIKATFATSAFVLGSKKPQPALIKFRTELRTDLCKVLLANSITLTPGTITSNLDGDVYTVHCLDKSMGDGIEECSFVKALLKMEKVMGGANE